MYVFFEHHQDSSGATLATDVVCSSYKNRMGIWWKRDENAMKLMARLFKTPPIAVRNFNEPLKIWTYLGDAGKHLLEVVQDTFEKLHLDVHFLEVENLEEQVRKGEILDDKSREFDPKNFFYNRAALNASPALTAEVAARKLASIFGVTEDELKDKLTAKKFYRQAAIRLHPDRNGGNGAGMSELNMYWSVYNA